jgi:8-oxo-dGTP diphosphatase
MKTKIQRVAVYGIIKNNLGQVLLVKRAGHDTRPGLWEFPGGGLEFGEETESGLKRELQEETGLEVVVKGVHQVITTLTESDTTSKHTIRLLYDCHLNGSTDEVTLSTEHDDYKWVGKDLVEETIQNISQKK